MGHVHTSTIKIVGLCVSLCFQIKSEWKCLECLFNPKSSFLLLRYINTYSKHNKASNENATIYMKRIAIDRSCVYSQRFWFNNTIFDLGTFYTLHSIPIVNMQCMIVSYRLNLLFRQWCLHFYYFVVFHAMKLIVHTVHTNPISFHMRSRWCYTQNKYELDGILIVSVVAK